MHGRGLSSSGASADETLNGSRGAPTDASAQQERARTASLEATSSWIPIRDAGDSQLVRSLAFDTLNDSATLLTLEHPTLEHPTLEHPGRAGACRHSSSRFYKQSDPYPRCRPRPATPRGFREWQCSPDRRTLSHPRAPWTNRGTVTPCNFSIVVRNASYCC